MTDANHTVVLETTTGPNTLADLQQTLDEVWSHQEVPEMTRIYMDLAVGEVGANIIEYARDGKPVRLRMEVTVLPGEVRATLNDDGSPSPVDLTRVSLPDDLSEQGRGLAIALKVLDELSYRRDEKGNHWTLVARLN